MSPFSPPVVLTFTPADPTGAGGVQADALAAASLGCHPVFALTALRVPGTLGEARVQPVDAELIEDQARALLQDMAVNAFKVGELFEVEAAQVVAQVVSDYADAPVVLDLARAEPPSEEWTEGALQRAVLELLLPQATLVIGSLALLTSLAARLEGTDEDDDAPAPQRAPDPGRAARTLIDHGAEFALVTDVDPAAPDQMHVLYDIDGPVRKDTLPRAPDVSAVRLRGGGDTLSAAVAALLAQGLDAPEAVAEAMQYTAATLEAAYRVGMASAVPDRLFWAADDDDDEDEDDIPGTA